MMEAQQPFEPNGISKVGWTASFTAGRLLPSASMSKRHSESKLGTHKPYHFQSHCGRIYWYQASRQMWTV